MSPGARAGKHCRSASGRDNPDFSPEGSGSGSFGGRGSLGPPCGGDSDPGDAREKRGGGSPESSSWRGNFRFSPLSSKAQVGRGRLLPGFVSSLLAGKKKKRKKERGERKRPDIQPDSQRAAGLLASPFIDLRSGNPTREAVILGRGAGAARQAHSGAAVPGAPWTRVFPGDPANAIQVNARGPGPGRGGSCAPGCESSAAPAGVPRARRSSGSPGAAALYPAGRPHS